MNTTNTESLADSQVWGRLLNSLYKTKMISNPKISVLVPTYNSAHLIRKTLLSIISQTYQNFEIIIVDAESKDRTFEIVREFSQYISHIYFVTDYDLALMYNKGISLAKGEYLSFLLPGHVYTSRYALRHIAELAADYNHPDLIYSASYASYSRAKNPFVFFHPFNFKFLKKGVMPTIIFSYWFRVKTLKYFRGLNTTYSFFKAWFELLCRFRKDPQMTIVSTKWVLTEFDYAELRTVVFLKDVWDRTVIIGRFFGPLYAFSWIWRKKTVPMFSWVLQHLKLKMLGK